MARKQACDEKQRNRIQPELAQESCFQRRAAAGRIGSFVHRRHGNSITAAIVSFTC